MIEEEEESSFCQGLFCVDENWVTELESLGAWDVGMFSILLQGS
jgi:hypothetical protein